MEIGARLRKLGIVVQDVSGYNEQDASIALDIITDLTTSLEQLGLTPFIIAPSNEGISVIFLGAMGTKYCALEIFNSGLVVFVSISNSEDNIEILQTSEELKDGLINLGIFLGK